MNSSHQISTEYPPPPVMLPLYKVMHNRNGPFEYVMAFRDKGQAVYRSAKKFPAEQAMVRSLATTEGKSKPGKEFSFAPLSKNAQNESTWAAFDCDDHTPGSSNSIVIGDKLLSTLKRISPETQYLYERTGRGTRLFLYSWKPRPCAEWTALIHSIAFDADVALEPGVCEAVPSGNESAGRGKPMRVPASFNPVTGTLNEIIEHNIAVDELLSAIGSVAAVSFPKGKKDSLKITEGSLPKGGASRFKNCSHRSRTKKE